MTAVDAAMPLVASAGLSRPASGAVWFGDPDPDPAYATRVNLGS